MHFIYRQLLRLYPTAYGEEFGEEMTLVFDDLHKEFQREGFFQKGLFIMRETIGLLFGAAQEHWRVLVRYSPDVSFPSRRFNMHHGFRFPKSTAALMAIILAGTILAIEKSKSVVGSLHRANPQASPLAPEQITFFGAFVVIFIASCLLAAVGWALLFALRRSGVHRLSRISATVAKSTRDSV